MIGKVLFLLVLCMTVTSNYGMDPNPDQRLLQSARRGDLSGLLKALEDGANSNAVDEHQKTALHWAVQENNFAVAEELVNQGALLTERDQDDNTPLQLAVKLKRDESFKVILMVPCGQLFHAAQKGNIELLRRVLKKGIPVNTVMLDDGCTPLHYAAAKGDPACIQELLSCGADPNACDKQKRTPLHYAAQAGKNAACLVLLKRTTLTDTDSHENSPSALALQAGYTVLAQDLAEAQSGTLSLGSLVSFPGDAQITSSRT